MNDSRTVDSSSTGLTCQVCSIGQSTQAEFDSVSSQREHFKSEWHRYNLQRKQNQRPILDWEQFQHKIENEDVLMIYLIYLKLLFSQISSISGSDSDIEEESQDEGVAPSKNKTQSMVAYVDKDGVQFQVWRCLLVPFVVEDVEPNLETAFHTFSELQSWCIILAKGGHFAAACFEKIEQKNPIKPTDQLYKIKVHKTLHRYVVRYVFCWFI